MLYVHMSHFCIEFYIKELRKLYLFGTSMYEETEAVGLDVGLVQTSSNLR